jgi:ABC transport system ATP-binding/permease protein
VSLARQRRVLSARYLACVLGDLGTLAVLVAQAPIIGWLCTVVWGSVEKDTPSLWFVLCLASVWFGCIGACREIVKERAIIERERFFGVAPTAVVLSKTTVLYAIGALQAVLLQAAVEWKLALHGPYVVQTLGLVLAAWCGTSLGLLVSSFARSQERAVGAVPLLLLPQILFSELAIPKDMFDDTVAVVEKAMPVRWAFRVFQESAALEPRWHYVAGALAAQLAFAAALTGAAALVLRSRREVAA